MTAREAAVLACRILAVYAFLQGLVQASYLRLWLPRGPGVEPLDALSIAGSIAAMFSMIGAAFLLWWRSHWIADRMIAERPGGIREARSSSSSPPPASVTIEAMHAVAFSTVGLWILVNSFSGLIGLFQQVVLFGAGLRSGAAVFDGLRAALIAVEVIGRIGLGVYLLFGGSGLAEFIRRGWVLARSTPGHGGRADPPE